MHSLLYAANTSSASVSTGSTISLGNTMRKSGCSCSLNGNSIVLSGVGYYDINATFTILPSAADTITIQAYKDGIPIPGAKSSVNTDATATIPVTLITRQVCCNSSGEVMFVVSTGISTTTVTVSNVSVSAVKL